DRGSIAAGDWLAEAILAALVLAVLAASGAAVAASRRLALAAASLVALAGWDALSLTWSPSPSLARDEALLTILYAVALLAPALAVRERGDRVAVLVAVTAITGALALATGIELVRATAADAVYLTGRLDFPISYPNAEAALFLIGLWPGLALASHKALPLAVRAFGLGGAAAAAGGWALAQSKGGALGIAVSTVVAVAVARGRLRLVPPLALAAVLTGAAFLRLTAPYRAPGGAELGAIHRAGQAEVGLFVAGALAGLVYAWLDRRIAIPERRARRIGHAAGLLLVAAIATSCSVFFATVRDPGDFFAARWQSFKHQTVHETGTTHLVSLGSSRYDFWRVALDELRLHPLAGVGSRGFRDAYLQHRRSSESPARAHSLELDALSETGIVGFLLLAAALVLAVGSFARRARDDLLALAALGAFACWLAQASVDWTWTFPAVGLPLFALVGAAAGRTGAPALRTRAGVVLAAAAGTLAVGGFGIPWLAQHYVHAALTAGPAAATDLDRARSLDPLSTDPLLARWALAPTARAGVAPLAAAVRMEPRSPDLRYALGRQLTLAGEKRAARRELRVALRLDPGDPVILLALRAAR
ncbi:MAG: O-antigen ligase family protein, partial [Gaiellaceae bacterium]